MVVNVLLPSMYRRAGRSFLLGFCTFLMGALLELAFQKMFATKAAVFIDDVLVGIAAGLVMFAYEQQRYRDLTRKLAMMTSMNHHVRNALQAILYSPYAEEQSEQIKVIQDAVNRIQWSLDKVLGGEADEKSNDKFGTAA